MRLRNDFLFAISLMAVVAARLPAQTGVALQPLAQHVRRVEDALNYLGQPLPPAVTEKINAAMGLDREEQAVSTIQRLLDPFVLAVVNINAESRVKVTQGEAKPELVES